MQNHTHSCATNHSMSLTDLQPIPDLPNPWNCRENHWRIMSTRDSRDPHLLLTSLPKVSMISCADQWIEKAESAVSVLMGLPHQWPLLGITVPTVQVICMGCHSTCFLSWFQLLFSLSDVQSVCCLHIVTVTSDDSFHEITFVEILTTLHGVWMMHITFTLSHLSQNLSMCIVWTIYPLLLIVLTWHTLQYDLMSLAWLQNKFNCLQTRRESKAKIIYIYICGFFSSLILLHIYDVLLLFMPQWLCLLHKIRVLLGFTIGYRKLTFWSFMHNVCTWHCYVKSLEITNYIILYIFLTLHHAC